MVSPGSTPPPGSDTCPLCAQRAGANGEDDVRAIDDGKHEQKTGRLADEQQVKPGGQPLAEEANMR